VLTCDASGNAYWGPASAVSVSALTYFVSASTPTGVSLQSGDRWFDTSSGSELVWINDGDSSQWIQICCGSGGGGGGTDTYVTGLTINGNEIVLTQNRTDIYSSFTISLSGITGGTSGDYLPLSGGTITGGTIFQSGLTANTISATTYQNLPVSGVTGGTGISTSTSGGLVTITNTAPDQTVTINSGTDISVSGTYPDFTIDYTGTGGGGTTLVASNSCVIPADGISYNGSSAGGWGFFNWDKTIKSSIDPRDVSCGIPVPILIRSNETISVCGIAYNNATYPDLDKLTVSLQSFVCDSTTVEILGNEEYGYGTDGVVCFNLLVTLTNTLTACSSFLLVGFSSTTSDATQIKISYSIKTPGTNK
jgi:hypothetical protein